MAFNSKLCHIQNHLNQFLFYFFSSAFAFVRILWRWNGGGWLMCMQQDGGQRFRTPKAFK